MLIHTRNIHSFGNEWSIVRSTSKISQWVVQLFRPIEYIVLALVKKKDRDDLHLLKEFFKEVRNFSASMHYIFILSLQNYNKK